MKCQDFSRLISAQLDGRLSLSEWRRLENHLGECSFCRDCAEELKGLRRELRQMPLPVARPEMVAEIMTVLQMEARLQERARLSVVDRREAWRVRIFAHSIGTAISLVLLLFLSMEILSPLHRTMMIARAMAASAVSGEDDEFNRISHLLLPLPPSRPNFSPSGALLGFSETSPEGEFVVAVVVDQNGRALIREVVEGQTDADTIARLSVVLNHQASFTPARREGKYVAASAVLMFSKVVIKA